MNAINSNNPARMSYRKSKKKGETYGHSKISQLKLGEIIYKELN
jgi:hypothetical protein